MLTLIWLVGGGTGDPTRSWCKSSALSSFACSFCPTILAPWGTGPADTVRGLFCVPQWDLGPVTSIARRPCFPMGNVFSSLWLASLGHVPISLLAHLFPWAGCLAWRFLVRALTDARSEGKSSEWVQSLDRQTWWWMSPLPREFWVRRSPTDKFFQNWITQKQCQQHLTSFVGFVLILKKILSLTSY